MKILELFSGYGTASFALKQLGIDYEIVGYSDIDKYANKCFRQNHWKNMPKTLEQFDNEYSHELGDIIKVDPSELEDFDLLTGGFPCQAFSVAGKCLGELDTRGTLFNEIIRIAEVKKPKYMLLENVKGLLSPRHKKTFKKILSELRRIGYHVHWKILNTKEHGIPQNRERVFIVCFRDHDEWFNFEYPRKEELKILLKDILESGVVDRDVSYCIDANYFKGTNVQSYFDKCRRQIVFHIRGKGEVPIEENRAYMIGNLSRYNMKSTRVPYAKFKGVAWALGTSLNQAVFWEGYFRKLTPTECFRLQGFLADEINLDGLSNTQRYKLAGNGQSVNVVKKIFENMFKATSFLNKESKE